jgi:hypothetical protein
MPGGASSFVPAREVLNIRAADAKEVGWGTPLKKRAATRIIQGCVCATFCQPGSAKAIAKFLVMLWEI